MKKVTFKAVFDRKHTATKTKAALVQIEIYCDRKRKYISTGVKLFSGQWDEKRRQVKNTMMANALNTTIESYLAQCEKYKAHCIATNTIFTLEGLQSALDGSNSDDLVAFIRERINSKNLRESSRRAQESALNTLIEFKRFHTFTDATYENVVHYDEFLHKRYRVQATIWGKHKLLKTYLNEAVRFGRINETPYTNFKVDKGKSTEGRFIRIEDMKKIEASKQPQVLEKVRDLLIVQFYTGLSFSDLMEFSYKKIQTISGKKVLMGKRVKTGVSFTIPLVKQVTDILDKYPQGLPRMSMTQYNLRIHAVCANAGIEYADDVSSHWARRGCGYWMLNNGVSMATVSRVLGHSSIRQTEAIYAKLLPRTIIDDVLEHIKKEE